MIPVVRDVLPVIFIDIFSIIHGMDIVAFYNKGPFFSRMRVESGDSWFLLFGSLGNNSFLTAFPVCIF